ncbi:hypothetical protein CD790_32405 [Streptomyces sp. SAJ15]|nr:hypothetical protein CD790_32405 [Streptomyces sp. SAJ15]
MGGSEGPSLASGLSLSLSLGGGEEGVGDAEVGSALPAEGLGDVGGGGGGDSVDGAVEEGGGCVAESSSSEPIMSGTRMAATPMTTVARTPAHA